MIKDTLSKMVFLSLCLTFHRFTKGGILSGVEARDWSVAWVWSGDWFVSTVTVVAWFETDRFDTELQRGIRTVNRDLARFYQRVSEIARKNNTTAVELMQKIRNEVRGIDVE